MSKKPKYQNNPSPSKIPVIPPSFKPSQEKVIFRFELFDANSKWDSDGSTHDFWDIANKLKAFEVKTWAELAADESKHHYVSVDILSKDAKQKFQKQFREYGEPFSLRLSGKNRLWGVILDNFFMVIWWDPDHKVCPSQRR